MLCEEKSYQHSSNMFGKFAIWCWHLHWRSSMTVSLTSVSFFGTADPTRRPEDGKLDIALRSFGGKAKAEEVGAKIMSLLKDSADGSLPVGDKSSPAEINAIFPGVSKSVFKKAVGALYKKGLVSPSPKSISRKE